MSELGLQLWKTVLSPQATHCSNLSLSSVMVGPRHEGTAQTELSSRA